MLGVLHPTGWGSPRYSSLARLFQLPGFIFAYLRQGWWGTVTIYVGSVFKRKSLKGEFFLGERPGLLGFALRCILLLSWCFNKTSSSNRRDDEGHYGLSMQIHPLDPRADSPAQLPGQTRRQNSFLREFIQKWGGSDTSVKDMSLTCNRFHGALQTACGYRIRRWGILTASRSVTPWFSIWWSPLASFILVFQRTTLLYEQFTSSF